MKKRVLVVSCFVIIVLVVCVFFLRREKEYSLEDMAGVSLEVDCPEQIKNQGAVAAIVQFVTDESKLIESINQSGMIPYSITEISFEESKGEMIVDGIAGFVPLLNEADRKEKNWIYDEAGIIGWTAQSDETVIIPFTVGYTIDDPIDGNIVIHAEARYRCSYQGAFGIWQYCWVNIQNLRVEKRVICTP